MEIYIDFNLYLSLIKREINKEIDYRYVLSKLRFIRRKCNNVNLPFSPAHMEEIAVNLGNGKPKDMILKRLNIIKFYSENFEYLPGIPPKEVLISNLESTPNLPELRETRRIWCKIIDQYNNGDIDESRSKTQRVREEPLTCFQRVVGDLDATEWAHKNDIQKIGRRSPKSLKENYEALRQSTDEIETFECLQRKKKLGPKRLANIKPTQIFNDGNVKCYLQEYLINKPVTNIIKGSELLKIHNNLETHIELMLDFLEIIGYYQENNNKAVKIRSRMHDISHAIYGANADYFVSNDIRFRNKLTAVYYFLEIPCKVISPETFIGLKLNSKPIEIIYT